MSRKRHNYRRKLERLLQAGQLTPPAGKVTIIDIYHDSYCAVWSGGACNCDPDIAERGPAVGANAYMS